MKEGDRRIKFQNVESGKKSERQNLIIIKKWPKFTLLKASFEKSERQIQIFKTLHSNLAIFDFQ
jgi:hypothetical protein